MFQCIRQHNGFEVRMDANLANVDLAMNQLQTFLEKQGQAGHLFALTLLAREGLNNAMIHGNKLNPQTSVIFRVFACNGGFDLYIEDEGEGFPWQEYLNTGSDIERESGRGHEIYRSYARTVSYNAKGNALTLEYRG